tara:strand:+ start:91 stop:1050 length:960 start_codon:yes stop_codon:yes gene_type:complete
MIKLKNNGKINFLVNIHYEFAESLTGGIVAMHYLAYLLAKEGHNVYIFCKPEYPHENIHVIKSWRTQRMVGKGINSDEAEIISWESFSYQHSNTVAIYDQDIYGNWFGTHNVARWVVYTGAKKIIDGWGANDYCFTYGEQKNMRKDISLPLENLIAMNMQLEHFKNEKNRREGFCYLFHKHTSPGADKFIKELNATDLSNWKKVPNFQNYLNEEFNNHEYFICYDQLSFWPQIAALCGCKVIVMNVKDNPNAYYNYNTTPEEYRLENPLKKYGVAFGFGDLQHAVNTQHLVEDHLKEMDKQNLETVKNFIKFWENKCYG